MIKFEDLKWKESSYIIGFIALLVLGAILINQGESETGFFSTTLGFAILSVGLAFKAIDIAKESEIRMGEIATSHFLEIVDKFEDKRILLTQHPKVLGIEGTIWKCRRYIDHSKELKERVEQKHQDDLAEHLYNLYYKTGINWDSDVIQLKDLKNMSQMCSDLITFDLSEERQSKVLDVMGKIEQLKTDYKQKHSETA